MNAQSFKQGCIKTATQSRYARMHKDSHTKPLHRCNGTNGCRCTDVATQTADEAVMRNPQSVHKRAKDARWRSHKVVMQGCIKTATQSRCTMQRHKWLSMHRCSGTNGCRCTDVATQTADEAWMLTSNNLYNFSSKVWTNYNNILQNPFKFVILYQKTKRPITS